MNSPYDIIEFLRETPGLNDKRDTLHREKDNKLFQDVLTYTFDPRLTFGIKKIPNYSKSSEFRSLSHALSELDMLIDRSITGNSAIDFLKDILQSLSYKDAKVVEQIIAKDFKAGFGVSLVNDEMKPFQIYSVPYMGATSYSPKRVKDIFKKNNKAISEVKMDGRYLNCVINKGKVFFESRGGKPNPLMNCLEDDVLSISKHLTEDVVLNGELLLANEPDRYRANGIISSFVSIAQKEFDGKDVTKEISKFEKKENMSFQDVKDNLTYVVWDYIPYNDYLKETWKVERQQRLHDIELAISLSEVSNVRCIEYKIVHSETEAIKHFQEMLARGEEGTILKSIDGIWKDGKPTWQCKMKVEVSVDLLIESFNFGTKGTKNENVISSLNCQSSCGGLKTSPGGIKEKDMKFITENMDSLRGSVVEVKCSGISKNSDNEYSLLHPVFIKIRDDKNTCDSLENIIEIDNMAKGLSNV